MFDLFGFGPLMYLAPDDAGGGAGGASGGDDDPNAGGGTDNQPTSKTFTQAELDAVVAKRLERERKSWEAKVEEEKRKAALTETERLKVEKDESDKRAAEAIRNANDRLVRAEVTLLASQLGIVDPDAALTLMARDGVSVDDSGKVVGVKEALEKLVSSKPYLKQQTAAPARSGGDFSSGGGGSSFTLEQVKAMTPAQINANWDKIKGLFGSK